MVCLSPTLLISLAIQESPPYSRQRRYEAKKGQDQKKTSLSVFFLFCRCCYSCKQKSRHPIIPVGEREGETGPSPASQPPPLQKKETEFGKDIIYQKHGLFVRAHHYLHLQSYTLADVRYSRNFTLFRNSFLSFSSSFCLSALPCHPQFETLPLKTLSGLAFLVCLSYLSVCLVSFSPPGRTTTLFTFSYDTDTNLSRNRPYCRSTLSAPL